MLTHSTPQSTPEEFAALGGQNLVYVREVTAGEALAGAPAAVFAEHNLTPEQVLFAVHRANGERLAVLGDRASAFAAALAHELAPVSVH